MTERTAHNDGCYRCGLPFVVGDPVAFVVAEVMQSMAHEHPSIVVMPICAACNKRLQKERS